MSNNGASEEIVRVNAMSSTVNLSKDNMVYEGDFSAPEMANNNKVNDQLKGESYIYLNKLIEALKDKNVDLAKSLIRDKKNQSFVSTAIWSIIPLLTKFVSTESMKDTFPMYEGCVKMLKNVSKIADPEDLVLCMLQEVQQATDDELFLSLLKPLQTSLIRLPRKRLKFVGWCLHSIWRYLMKLPSPEDYCIEDEAQKLLVDADPIVERISCTYYESLPFYDPFIMECKKCRTKEQLEMKNLLIRYMTNSLDTPLALLDLQIRQGTKSRARRIAEKLVENITTLMPDIYTFLSFQTERIEKKIIRDLSLGVLYYLCLCENYCMTNAPKVYNTLYIFQNALYFCVALLKAVNSQFSVERGLILAEHLVASQKNANLSHEILDSHVHSRFAKVLTSIMVVNPCKDYRSKSLKILNMYMDIFNTRGKYQIILNLVQILSSANVKAYLFGVYKEMWHKAFLNLKEEDELNPYFSGYKLLTLLKLFCHLPDAEQSDLIEPADQIIASLNVLRYMVLRDRANKSKIWDFIPTLDASFLSPLKKGIMLSQVHYEARVKNVAAKDMLSVTVDGTTDLQDEMFPEDTMNVLQAALTTFDMMDSILCSLNEDIARGPTAVQ